MHVSHQAPHLDVTIIWTGVMIAAAAVIITVISTAVIITVISTAVVITVISTAVMEKACVS